MKALIILVVGLLSVGCLTPEQKQQKTLRDSMVGEYEDRFEGSIISLFLLENGIVDWYKDGKKLPERKWEIVDGHIHIPNLTGEIHINRINKDGSFNVIGWILDGKRTYDSNPKLPHYKRIK